MEPAFILLSILVGTGLVLYLLDRRGKKNSDADEAAPAMPDNAGCTDDSCVLHGSCPSERLLTEACKEKVVYYDDEELDRFAGRASDDYSDAEIEEFRDILYTLRHDDLLGWQHSTARRGITLPDPIHDELLMLLADQP